MMTLAYSAASVMLFTPTANILKYAFDEIIQLPEFDYLNKIIDQEGNKLSPIVPLTIINSGADALPFNTLTNPQQVSIVHDEFIKQRSGQYKYFYPIKGVQSRVKLSHGNLADLMALKWKFLEIIDRDDAAAEDINSWMQQTYGGDQKIYFHCVNAYETTYMADATNLDDQRNVFSGDIIIKADYHTISDYR
jgi:hypothetical protein